MRLIPLLFCCGCAMVRTPHMQVISFGQALAVICQPTGVATDSPGAAFVQGPCEVVRGGAVSGTWPAMLGQLGAIAGALGAVGAF